MNFEKFIIGMIALIVGIILFIWITNARNVPIAKITPT